MTGRIIVFIVWIGFAFLATIAFLLPLIFKYRRELKEEHRKAEEEKKYGEAVARAVIESAKKKDSVRTGNRTDDLAAMGSIMHDYAGKGKAGDKAGGS